MIRRYLDWAHPWTNYYNAPFVGDNAPLVSSRSGGHRRRLVASAANRSGAAALVAEVRPRIEAKARRRRRSRRRQLEERVAPRPRATAPAADAPLLGGEGAMWTELVDHTNFECRVWPRAAAVAERAWSPTRLRAYKNASTAPRATSTRLGAFRCHLMARGVAVMPASARWNYAYGSNRAGAPGSCMVQ